MARQRLNQLPATREALREKEQGKPLALPTVPDEWVAPAERARTLELAASEANVHVETLKKNPATAGIPIVVLTGLASELSRFAGLESWWVGIAWQRGASWHFHCGAKSISTELEKCRRLFPVYGRPT